MNIIDRSEVDNWIIFAGIVVGIDGSMVIEYAQCLLSSSVDRSLVNRLFLGRGDE